MTSSPPVRSSSFFLSAADIRPLADWVATVVDALPFQVVFSESVTKRCVESCTITEDYTSEEKAKLAGVAAGANNYQHPATHPASVIVQDSTHRFVTDTEKTTWNGKASTAVATQSANGLMSAADKKKLDGITDDILSLPGEGYEEVEIVDQVSMSASGVMVKVVPGFVLFIIKSVQFGGLKTAKFTLPGFIIGSVLTPAAFRAPGGTCTTIYISTATDKTNKCSNIMFSGVDNAGEVTAPLTFAIQATSFSRE